MKIFLAPSYSIPNPTGKYAINKILYPIVPNVSAAHMELEIVPVL